MDVGWGFSSPLIFRSAFASAAAISPIHLHQQFLSFRFFSFLFFSFFFLSFLFFSFLFFSLLHPQGCDWCACLPQLLVSATDSIT